MDVISSATQCRAPAALHGPFNLESSYFQNQDDLDNACDMAKCNYQLRRRPGQGEPQLSANLEKHVPVQSLPQLQDQETPPAWAFVLWINLDLHKSLVGGVSLAIPLLPQCAFSLVVLTAIVAFSTLDRMFSQSKPVCCLSLQPLSGS